MYIWKEGGHHSTVLHVSKGGPFGFTLTPNVTHAPFRRWNGTIVNAGPLGFDSRRGLGGNGMVWRSDGVTVSYGYSLLTWVGSGFDVFGWRL